MIHDLKILPEWFETVKSGIKTFEVRKDDRNFQPNDVLLLREFDGAKYTGRQLKADVRFILRGEYCREGYCIMSIKVQNRNSAVHISRTSGFTCMNVCSICSRGPILDTYKYCPYCGAKMDGGGDSS